MCKMKSTKPLVVKKGHRPEPEECIVPGQHPLARPGHVTSGPNSIKKEATKSYHQGSKMEL